MNERLTEIDRVIRGLLSAWAVPLLRISLGVVFVWFGALKVFNVTPVTDLVAETVYWVDPDWFVPLLGWVEVLVGVALILRRALRLILPVFLAQLVGTFLVLILQPDVAFQNGNLFKLTVEGEFVIKNLVLLSAGLVVGATIDDEHLPVASDPDVLVP
jgi:uncharacterized membrane protein YkgB